MVPLRHMTGFARALTWLAIERFAFDATLKTGEKLETMGAGDGVWESVYMIGPLYDLGLKTKDVTDMGLSLPQLVAALTGFSVFFLMATLMVVWRRDRPTG